MCVFFFLIADDIKFRMAGVCFDEYRMMYTGSHSFFIRCRQNISIIKNMYW